MDEIVGRFIDPFNLSGLRRTKASKKRERYDRALQEYRALWIDAKQKGIPLELMGYDPPKAQLVQAGLGSGAGGIPGVGPPIPLVPVGVDSISEDTIEAIEAKNDEVKDTIESVGISRGDFADPIRTSSSSSSSSEGDDIDDDETKSPPTDEKEAKSFQDEIKEAKRSVDDEKKDTDAHIGREYVRQTLAKNKNLRTQGAIGVKSGDVRNLIYRMASDERGLFRLGGDAAARARQNEIRKVWGGNPDFQNRIIQVFNDAGISFSRGGHADRIAQISNMSGPEVAKLHNDIMNLFISQSGSDDPIFETIDESKLEPEPIPQNVEPPISEIPGVHTYIRRLLEGRGVHSKVATRFANELINKMGVVSGKVIGTVGDIDIGRSQARVILGTYLREIDNALKQDESISRVNTHNLSKMILGLIFDTKKAVNTIGGENLGDNIEILRNVAMDATRNPVGEVDLPTDELPRGAQGEILQGRLFDSLRDLDDHDRIMSRLDDSVFEEGGILEGEDRDLLTPGMGSDARHDSVLEGVERKEDPLTDPFTNPDIWEDVFESDSDTSIQDETKDDIIEQLRTSGRGPTVLERLREFRESWGARSRPRRDPGGMPTGNVIINNPTSIARMLRGWGESADVFRSGRFRWRVDPPDPDDPPGRGDTITVWTPWGRRSFSQRNLVKAMVIMGVSAASISEVIKSLKKDKGVKKVITITPPPKSPPRKPGSPIQPRPPPKFDIHDVDTHPAVDSVITSKAYTEMSTSEKAQEILNHINQLTIDGNKPGANLNVINAKKQGFHDELERVKARGMAPPDRDPRPVPRTIDPFTIDRTAVDVTSKTNAKIPLTKAIIDSGLRDKVVKYNDWIELLNSNVGAYTVGSGAYQRNVLDRKTKLDALYEEIKNAGLHPRQPAAAEVPSTELTGANLHVAQNDLVDATRELNTAQVDYFNAKDALELASSAPGSSKASIESLYLDYERKRGRLEHLENVEHTHQAIVNRREAEDEHVKNLSTFLYNPALEHFPTTYENFERFDRTQQLEKALSQFRNGDSQNWYNVLMNRDGNKRAAFESNEAYYDNRLSILRELFKNARVALPPPIKREDPSIDTSHDISKLDDPSSIIRNLQNTTMETNDLLSTNRAPNPEDIEHFERPMRTIGGEAPFIVSSVDEKLEEDRLWREYSLVRPGHGNGGVMRNSLYRHNLNQERSRFGPLPLPKKAHKPCVEPPVRPHQQPQPINIYQTNDRFLADGWRGNSSFGFTDETLKSVRWNEYENSNNGYMPEHVLNKYEAQPVRIMPQRSDGQRFVPYGYSYGEAIDNPNTYGGVRNEDVPYANAKGYPSTEPTYNCDYQMAIKSIY